MKEKIRKLLDLIYPSSLYCDLCGNIIDDSRIYNLCDHCIKSIHWDFDPPSIHEGIRMIRCAEYGIYERTLIFSLKYNGKLYIAKDIAEMIHDRLLQSELPWDVVVPVPMFSKKEFERGFNQAKLISEELARISGKEICEDALIRNRATKPMRGLSPEERSESVRDAFSLREGFGQSLSGKDVIILDDFFTTGATAKACTCEIHKARPHSVSFVAFAAKY